MKIVDTVKKNFGTIGLIVGGLVATGVGAYKALNRGADDYDYCDEIDEVEDFDGDSDGTEDAPDATEDPE